MFEREIDDFLEKLRSRREFLKLSGKGVAGIAVSASMLNLLGCTDDAVALVTAEGILLAESNKCTGCQRCEMVCTAFNDDKIQPYISRVKINRTFNYGNEITDDFRDKDGYFGNFLMTPETCKQCEEPKCAEACPEEAISLHEDLGAWVVDEKKCIGCGACTTACPWEMAIVDPEDKKSKKCILCGACAENCITGALSVMPWEKVTAKLNRKGYIFA